MTLETAHLTTKIAMVESNEKLMVEMWLSIDIPATQHLFNQPHLHLASTQIVWFATKDYLRILIPSHRHGKSRDNIRFHIESNATVARSKFN